MRRLFVTVLLPLCLALLFPYVAYPTTLYHEQTFVVPSRKDVPPTWEDTTTGNRYKLVSVHATGEVPHEVSKKCSRTSATINVPLSEVFPVQTEKLRARFPKEQIVSEGGFFGSLPLTAIKTEPVYQMLERQVDKQIVRIVSTNDIEDLPKEMVFDTSSGKQTLKRAAVSFDVAELDGTQTQRGEDGMPKAYKATITFRGLESYSAMTHCRAYAQYAGTLRASTSSSEKVHATYVFEEDQKVPQIEESKEASVPAQPAPISLKSEPPSIDLPKPDPLPVLPLAASASGASVALLLILFGATRNARLVASCPAGEPRSIARVRIKQKPNGYECSIPSWIDIERQLLGGEQAVLIPGKRLRDKDAFISVRWRKRALYSGSISRRIELAVRGVGAPKGNEASRSKPLVTAAAVAVVVVVVFALALLVFKPMIQV